MKARHSILSSSPGRRFFVVVSFFFIHFSSIFYCCRRFSCKKGVFFFFLHFQSFSSPPVSSFAYRGNAQMSERHSLLSSFYSCPFLFTLLIRGTACNSTRLQRAKKKDNTTDSTEILVKVPVYLENEGLYFKAHTEKPHSFL